MKTTPLKSNNSSEIPAAASRSTPFGGSHSNKTNLKMDVSPIASAPRNSIKLPSGLSLSPQCLDFEMKQPECTPEIPESTSSFWTSTLLSPMLKLFANNNNNENNESSIISQVSSDDSTDTNSETKLNEDESVESKTIETDDEMEEVVAEEEDSISYEFDPFVFMAQLPPHQLVRHNVPDPRSLPRPNDMGKPTLVLDLDETLVHCSADSRGKWDVTFGVQFNGTLCQVYVRKRPHLETFLEAVSSRFEVVVFTASQRVYAERLLDILDPQRKYIHHRLYRESCLMVAGNLMKDLTILDRDLRRTVIVDNSPHAFGYQIDNGIPIESWYEDPHDVELLKLLPLLEQLHQVPDVRPRLRQIFRLQNLVNEARIRC